MAATRGGNTNKYFSIQIDAELKKDFLHFCDCCGLTISDAIYMLAKKTIEQQTIPFKVEPLEMYAEAVSHKPKEGPKSDRLTIRMDRELQDVFADACDNIGVTRSVLVRMFFMRCLNDNQLSFL